jgi:hypothetical protein
MHIFHKWSKWGKPVDAYAGRIQWRICEVCNAVDYRKIPYANQSYAQDIEESLSSLKDTDHETK